MRQDLYLVKDGRPGGGKTRNGLEIGIGERRDLTGKDEGKTTEK